ncbi:MAG: hypothetical protein M3245_03055, partial [Actinomycetota bacterium]|nr:hypothetical protein [Actinomycetota bacterium]
QEAFADWLNLTRTGGTWHIAYAYRSATTDSAVAIQAYLGRGTCRRTGGGWWCSARLRGRDLAPEQFEVDPLLRTASLNIATKRERHRLTWRRRGHPSAGVSTNVFAHPEWGGFAGTGGGLDAWAPARGVLFNEKMLPKAGRNTWHEGFLFEGAGAGGYASPGAIPGRGVTRNRDGSITLTRMVRAA